MLLGLAVLLLRNPVEWGLKKLAEQGSEMGTRLGKNPLIKNLYLISCSTLIFSFAREKYLNDEIIEK